MRLLSLVLLLPCSLPAENYGVRLILGLGDAMNTKWDGTAAVRNATLASIEPWRFETPDRVTGSSWTCSLHPIRLFGGQNAPQPVPVANGVTLWLTGASESAAIEITTAQGNFTVDLSAIPYGTKARFLNGRVIADRLPPFTQVTNSAEEQDYPAAAAGKSGEIWLAYLEFKHHPDKEMLRANFSKAPDDFTPWASKALGDQILVKRQSNGRWSDPIQVTAPGGDLYRPAIAIDGKARAWVFWSANNGEPGKPNFDLWARAINNDNTFAAPLRLTTAQGSDVFPVAAADSQGRVHVAWQAWRDGRAQVMVASQNGDAFSAPVNLSTSNPESKQGNDWNPAIAAGPAGRVTVAFETYRNGNYDIFMRTLTGASWGKDIVAAATARYEAYPSIAYAPDGRLWLAYEEGGERWGKDFGADESSGVALYQGRAIRVRGWEPDGRVIEPASDVGTVLPGTAEQRLDSQLKQSDSNDWLKPRPESWKTRPAARPTPNFIAPKNNYPRLHVDASGRLWLAARSNHPITWNPVGTVWSEYVVSYDGDKWTGPIFLAHSGNLLDNRPALVSTAAGELTILGSSDHRRMFQLLVNGDPFNNDLYANVVKLPAGSGKLAAKAAEPPKALGLTDAELAESSAVVAMRNAKIVRGEFHRHSEVSMDGGNDGSLLEQWRYLLDAARMDWAGCCDHDNGGGREYSWWIEQKLTDMFYTPGKFVPLFSYERSVAYPEGHRNVVFANRGIRPLPRLPITAADNPRKAPDTQLFYAYLKRFDGVVASHTSGTNMGTDWRDNDPLVEPVVEIYQGDRQNYEMPGAPRTNKEQDSIGGWRPKGFVSLALEMGYKLAFQASSDHVSTHMSYCNIVAPTLTREALMDAFHKRHVYGSTDNILADFRSGAHVMGDSFSTAKPPEFKIKLRGTTTIAKVVVVKDNQYVYTTTPNKSQVEFTWRDATPAKGKTSYYYVRAEQSDGEVAWVSPMWITYTGK